jgi:hypothetical protein
MTFTHNPMESCKTKYEVFVDGKLVLTTYDAFTAECEKQMTAGKCEIRVTWTQK